jgi:UDP-N-acetylmuramoylalanine-D-glutamate ligase
LDWHKDINDCWDAKLNLFKNTDFVKYPNIEDENNYKFFKTDLNDFVKFLKEILEYFRINLDYDAIIETINQIPSLPHRFQLIKQIDQTKIYDD